MSTRHLVSEPAPSGAAMCEVSAPAGGDVRAIIETVLLDYRLSNMMDDAGFYPLVDLMSQDGKSIATGKAEITRLADAIAASITAATSGSEGGGEAAATQKLLDKALAVLGRCHTVLFNMARENEGAIFNRWPIHHEPLRSDARNLLPLIDEVLGDD